MAIKFHPDKNRDDPDAEEKARTRSSCCCRHAAHTLPVQGDRDSISSPYINLTFARRVSSPPQTLSDPDLRRKYNEVRANWSLEHPRSAHITLAQFGPKESAPEGGFVDPEEVFGAIFGGERFVPIIGHISLARDMKSAMQEVDEEDENSSDALAHVSASGSSGPTSPRLGKNGKPQLSPEEKARKDEKARAAAAEVVPSPTVLQSANENIISAQSNERSG